MLDNNRIIVLGRLSKCFAFCMTDKSLNQFSWLPHLLCILGMRWYVWVCAFLSLSLMRKCVMSLGSCSRHSDCGGRVEYGTNTLLLFDINADLIVFMKQTWEKTH